MSNKLNEYDNQFEYFCIQIHKSKMVEESLKAQVSYSIKSCNESNEGIASLKTQLEALRLNVEKCNKHEEISNKFIKYLKLQVK